MRDPVVPFRLALYGAVTRIRKHFGNSTAKNGCCRKSFRTIPGWPGVFTHDTLRIVWAVYVDDFKLMDVEQDVEPAWKTISEAVSVQLSTEIGRNFGCNRLLGESTMTDADDILGRRLPGILDKTKKWGSPPCKVRTVPNDLSKFMAQRVDSSLTLAGKPVTCFTKLRRHSLTRARLGLRQTDHRPELRILLRSRCC